MELITGLGGFVFVAALSGIIGNKADLGLDTLIRMMNRLKPGETPTIQRAVGRAFLLAQQSLVEDCRSELIGENKSIWDCPPQYKNEVSWLDHKLKRLKADLQKLEKGEFGELAATPVADIDSLLTSDGAGDTVQVVRQQLKVILQQEHAIALYQKVAVTPQVGLFERMCACFAVEMQQNPVLREMIQGQLLTQINSNLKRQQVTVEDIETSLTHLGRDMGEIKGCLECIHNQLSTHPAVPLQFQSLIAEKTEGFVGREFVFGAIQDFLQQQPNGYFIIEADPGVGKSAILAEYVRQTGCVAYFNVRSQGINRADDFLKSVCRQLIERYQLPYDLPLHPENTRDGNFLARLLTELAPKHSPVVIAVDALDEVEMKSQTDGANVLYLPQSLPNGVYFILTKRQTYVPLTVNKPYLFNLMEYGAESLQDVQRYIEQQVQKKPSLQQWVENQGQDTATFITTLAQKSDRNFMYLRYVLEDIESGAYQDLNLANLPQGLQQYYYQHWQRMGMTAKPLPRTKIKIVYVLAEARKPVSSSLISQFAGEDALTVQEVLDDWDQFLREEQIEGQTRYSIYHASFQDFLHRKEIVKKAGITIRDINALIADNLAEELGL
ncbi:MAG: hypothetical protein RIM23_27945 [Coleofasciculus sp. G3-WIS-01]|uniref:hypothetical protein n=1 Tax=Coleofasciculus sp. G3-WIS-01 TaxID=3069528 RepID=UPI0032F87112